MAASRDIRADLKERLQANVRERDELKSQYELRYKVLEDEAKHLSALLAIEDKRYDNKDYVERRQGSVADFFMAELSQGPKSKTELRRAAERAGYFADTDAAGRTTHVTLINFVRSGRVTKSEEGIYEIAPTH
jgi:hypothetical protein